jgi:hypothetical protein
VHIDQLSREHTMGYFRRMAFSSWVAFEGFTFSLNSPLEATVGRSSYTFKAYLLASYELLSPCQVLLWRRFGIYRNSLRSILPMLERVILTLCEQ